LSFDDVSASAPDRTRVKTEFAGVPKPKAQPDKAPDRHLIISTANLWRFEDSGCCPLDRSAIANRLNGRPNNLSQIVGAAQHGARRVGVAVIDGEGDGYSLDELRHCMARKMSLMKAVKKNPSENATISVR
jgi:hypothetical protein